MEPLVHEKKYSLVCLKRKQCSCCKLLAQPLYMRMQNDFWQETCLPWTICLCSLEGDVCLWLSTLPYKLLFSREAWNHLAGKFRIRSTDKWNHNQTRKSNFLSSTNLPFVKHMSIQTLNLSTAGIDSRVGFRRTEFQAIFWGHTHGRTKRLCMENTNGHFKRDTLDFKRKM